MISTDTNMSNLPCNYGVIKDGKKYMGQADVTEKGKVVRIVNTDDKISHLWTRGGFCSYQMREDETVEEGWEMVGKRRKLIESRKMVSCPFELKDDGKCPHRHEPDHEKWHYHFSLRKGLEIVRNNEGKPYCRYHLTGNRVCWLVHNGPHRLVFVHM